MIRHVQHNPAAIARPAAQVHPPAPKRVAHANVHVAAHAHSAQSSFEPHRRELAGELTAIASNSSGKDLRLLLGKVARSATPDAGSIAAHLVTSDAWKNGNAKTRDQLSRVAAYASDVGLQSLGTLVSERP